MTDIMIIADTILDKCNKKNIPVSNLKLQKLCYYAQGLSLAIYNKPLFEEEIEAWNHGPVVSKLYNNMKQYGSSPIIGSYSEKTDNKDINNLINMTIDKFASFSAWTLRDMTHEKNSPWSKVFQASKNNTINENDMKNFFKEMLYKEDNLENKNIYLSLSEELIKENKEALDLLADK